MDARFLAYLLVSALLIVTPGPDMALIARNAVRGGYPAARSTAFGVGAGILLWGVFTSVGLASALAASAGLFAALKLAGAAFAQGLLGNLLNPKAGAIFVAVVPQFIEPADAPSRLAAMTGAFVVMVTVWLIVYGLLIARTARRFGPAIRRALDGFAGAVMVGLGVRLAVERR